MTTLLYTHQACLRARPRPASPGIAGPAAGGARRRSRSGIRPARPPRGAGSRARGSRPGASAPVCRGPARARCPKGPCRDRCRYGDVAGLGRGGVARRRRGRRRGRCGGRRRGGQRVLRGAPARPSRRAGRAMGFCLFNNAAVGALRAREVHGLRGSRSSISTCITATARRPPSRTTPACSTPRRTSTRSIPAPARRARPGSATSSMCRCAPMAGSRQFRLGLTQRHPAGARRVPPRAGADLGGFRRPPERSARAA